MADGGGIRGCVRGEVGDAGDEGDGVVSVCDDGVEGVFLLGAVEGRAGCEVPFLEAVGRDGFRGGYLLREAD